MFKGQSLPNLHTSSIHLASSLKASGHWESHRSTSNPSTLSWWRRMRPETGRNLGGSVRLYCEMAPQTATLPNVFMFASTVSNHSPPTWGERKHQKCVLAAGNKNYVLVVAGTESAITSPMNCSNVHKVSLVHSFSDKRTKNCEVTKPYLAIKLIRSWD